MTDAISTLTLAPSAATSRPAPVAPAQAVAAETPKAASSTKPLSPRMVSDPVSGVMITEYYNSNGDLSAQLPSAAAVAYLRMGLTESGTMSQSPTGDVVA